MIDLTYLRKVLWPLIVCVYIAFSLFTLYSMIMKPYLDFMHFEYFYPPVTVFILTLIASVSKKFMLGALFIDILVGFLAGAFYEFSGIGCIDAGTACLHGMAQAANLFIILVVSSVVLILLRNFKVF